MFEDFIWIGKDLFEEGLVDSHSGNMSIRRESSIFITRKGAMFNHLKEEDIIEVPIDSPSPRDSLASVELLVHRAVYKNTEATAILHAHPKTAIALSMTEAKIIPQDSEGLYVIKSVPVVKVREGISSEEVAKLLPPIFAAGYVIAVVSRHGSFSASTSLEKTYQYTSCLESSCQIIKILRDLSSKRPEIKERRPAIPPGIGVMGRTYRRGGPPERGR